MEAEELTQSPASPIATATEASLQEMDQAAATGTSVAEAPSQVQGQVYYVSPSGNDSYPGTLSQPFRTINAGVDALGPGDTLYVRAGSYHETLDIRVSGTASERITIAAYPGERPFIDGQGSLPGDYRSYMVILRGDYLTLDGFEIGNLDGIGVGALGSYSIVRNCKVHHCQNKGILVSSGSTCSEQTGTTGSIVEHNEVWMTSLVHQGINEGGHWAGAISVARCPLYTVVRNNVVHETWGLGIQAYEALHTTIEDNTVWNNQMSHYYVNNAPYTLLQRNISYNTADTMFLFKDHPGAAYVLADESPDPMSHHVTVINNLSYGSDTGFYFFYQQSGSGMKQVLVAHNTFVNSLNSGLTIREGDHQDSRIWNNIFYQDSLTASTPNDSELDFSHNFWSESPPAAASSPDDQIGNPLFTHLGSVGPGQFDPDWLMILSGSPAIDAGAVVPEVGQDFVGVARPTGATHDIGAYESPFSGQVRDLRITGVSGSAPNLVVTLRWTAPLGAVTYTMRGNDTPVTADNWDSSAIIPVSISPSAPGTVEQLTVPAYQVGDVLYIALRAQLNDGTWSDVSNNAFWPQIPVYLPMVVG